MARGSSPESPGRRMLIIFLVYCIVSLFYNVSVLSPVRTRYTMERYSLFVLTVPLNTEQTNRQTCWNVHGSVAKVLDFRRANVDSSPTPVCDSCLGGIGNVRLVVV